MEVAEKFLNGIYCIYSDLPFPLILNKESPERLKYWRRLALSNLRGPNFKWDLFCWKKSITREKSKFFQNLVGTSPTKSKSQRPFNTFRWPCNNRFTVLQSSDPQFEINLNFILVSKWRVLGQIMFFKQYWKMYMIFDRELVCSQFWPECSLI